jgi:hypothetical protein
MVWSTGHIRSSHIDLPVDKELENSKRWLICLYLRDWELRRVKKRKCLCCEYASAVCYSLWLYCEMLLKDYMHRVSDRLLSETSTSEMAIDGRRPPCATRSDIKRPVYISHSLTGRQKNNNAVIINVHLCSHSEQFAL